LYWKRSESNENGLNRETYALNPTEFEMFSLITFFCTLFEILNFTYGFRNTFSAKWGRFQPAYQTNPKTARTRYRPFEDKFTLVGTLAGCATLLLTKAVPNVMTCSKHFIDYIPKLILAECGEWHFVGDTGKVSIGLLLHDLSDHALRKKSQHENCTDLHY